jgi:hypothetical protein
VYRDRSAAGGGARKIAAVGVFPSRILAGTPVAERAAMSDTSTRRSRMVIALLAGLAAASPYAGCSSAPRTNASPDVDASHPGTDAGVDGGGGPTPEGGTTTDGGDGGAVVVPPDPSRLLLIDWTFNRPPWPFRSYAGRDALAHA